MFQVILQTGSSKCLQLFPVEVPWAGLKGVRGLGTVHALRFSDIVAYVHF